MPKYAIFDLDNCLADDEWRLKFINRERTDQFGRYNDYHSLAGFDLPNAGTMRKLHSHAVIHRHKILVLTGRPVRFRALTLEWLRRVHVIPHQLLMRNEDCAIATEKLKEEQLRWLGEYGVLLADIVAAYDDREEVVAMYQHHGIPAEVLAINVRSKNSIDRDIHSTTAGQ